MERCALNLTVFKNRERRALRVLSYLSYAQISWLAADCQPCIEVLPFAYADTSNQLGQCTDELVQRVTVH